MTKKTLIQRSLINWRVNNRYKQFIKHTDVFIHSYETMKTFIPHKKVQKQQQIEAE